MNQDKLYRYLLEQTPVRGELAQLEKSYQDILSANDYPLVLKKLLGELLAATTLLTATIKFEGDIAVQIQGDGPVSLAVINGNHKQQVRGLARWKKEASLPDAINLSQLFGKGYLVITITPEQGERYQGVVSLDKNSVAECIQDYFLQSEQLPTNIWLFANGLQAAGIMLQVLPSDQDKLGLDHLTQLTTTITEQELLTLPAEEVLHRLYHQEQVRIFEPVDVTFQCHCSKERCIAAIQTLDRAEVDSMLAEDGKIEMGCEYCNHKYQFDSIDIESIFASQALANKTH